MAIDSSKISRWFACRELTEQQAANIKRLRRSGEDFANLILDLCPSSADQTRAITKVREAVETGTTAITNGGSA